MNSCSHRWEACEELSEEAWLKLSFVQMLIAWIHHRSINISTPLFKSFAPVKPLNKLHDKVLDILRPLSTIYEHLLSTFHTMEKDGVIELDKESASMFVTCIKHAIRMTGRFHPHSWQTQRASAPKDQPTFDILGKRRIHGHQAPIIWSSV